MRTSFSQNTCRSQFLAVPESATLNLSNTTAHLSRYFGKGAARKCLKNTQLKHTMMVRRVKDGFESCASLLKITPSTGVPALPPARLGYRHCSQQPIYAVDGKMYKVPTTECEHTLFHVHAVTNNEATKWLFPKGGHNYYNGRNVEHLMNRIAWLADAKPAEEGWETRYAAILRKKKIYIPT